MQFYNHQYNTFHIRKNKFLSDHHTLYITCITSIFIFRLLFPIPLKLFHIFLQIHIDLKILSVTIKSFLLLFYVHHLTKHYCHYRTHRRRYNCRPHNCSRIHTPILTPIRLCQAKTKKLFSYLPN